MNAREIMQRLKAPFPAERLGWKPGKLTADGKRCLAMAYIDARDVQGRLDDVVPITVEELRQRAAELTVVFD